ncbi:MAG: hypothetical protein R3264_10740 [Anaerolineae bacterium]|nr:hypothetical protein [Anaerolineae bacterium]
MNSTPVLRPTLSPPSPKTIFILIATIFSIAATTLIVLSTSATSVTPGTDPFNAVTLEPGFNYGKIAPHSNYWFTFSYHDFTTRQKYKDLDFSLFATPSDGNLQHHISFELYPWGETNKWARGEGHLMQNFGAGMLVSRDGDDLTAERFWHGTVILGDLYLLSIKNDTDHEIDFILYDAEIHAADFSLIPPSEPAAVRPDPTPEPVIIADGATPHTPLPLQTGVTKGGLEPGQERWYSFSITDFDGELHEEMALTMVATPDDGHRIHYTTFDLFTVGAVQNWQPGSENRDMRNFGAGSLIYRDNNPETGERFWHGWIIDNDHYLVRIRNYSDAHMDYWLYDDNIYAPELD